MRRTQRNGRNWFRRRNATGATRRQVLVSKGAEAPSELVHSFKIGCSTLSSDFQFDHSKYGFQSSPTLEIVGFFA